MVHPKIYTMINKIHLYCVPCKSVRGNLIESNNTVLFEDVIIAVCDVASYIDFIQVPGST